MDLASRALIAKNLQNGRIMEWQKQAHEAKTTGQTDLFGSSDMQMPHLDLEQAEPWTEMEALEAEREAIGFYLSGHPLDRFFEILELANWYNEIKRENNLKYGSHLLNRPKETKSANHRYKYR